MTSLVQIAIPTQSFSITSTSFPWLRDEGLEETAASNMSFLPNPYDGFNVQANSIVYAA